MKSQVCCTSIIVLYNKISLFTKFLTQGQGYGKPPLGASKLDKVSEKKTKNKRDRNAKKQWNMPCFFPLQIMLLYFDFKLFFFKNKANNVIYNNKLRPVVHWTILLMKSRSNCLLAHCCFCIFNWIVKQFARFVHTWNC